MSDRLWVDPVALRNVAPQFDALSDRMTALLTTLTGVLDAEGASWGGDEGGTKFADGYVPGAESVSEACGAMGALFTEVGAGLRGVADRFEETDKNNAYAVGSIL